MDAREKRKAEVRERNARRFEEVKKEMEEKRRNMLPPQLSPEKAEQLRLALLKLRTPEVERWEQSAKRIKEMMEQDEALAMVEWKDAIMQEKESLDSVTPDRLYMHSPSDELIHNLFIELIKTNGIQRVVELMKKNREITNILFNYMTEVDYFRPVVIELMRTKNFDAIEFFFSITSENRYYGNIFAEMVWRCIKHVQPQSYYGRSINTIDYEDLSVELYPFFLNIGSKYLRENQMLRFNADIIYYFELAKAVIKKPYKHIE